MRARKAARALALAPARRRTRRCMRWRKRSAPPRRKSSPPTRATSPKPGPPASPARSSTASRSTARASRRWPKGLEIVAKLKDPVGDVMDKWKRPNGMTIERVRTPIGVIGVIYESRPNVTADAGALCLKAGNAAILRGGSDSHRLLARDPCRDGRGPSRRRTAGRCDPAGADARPRRGRRDAVRPRAAISM